MSLFRGVRRVSVMTLVIIIIGALGFCYKIWEFIQSLSDAEAAGFAIVPLGSYFLTGFGFLLLLVWSISRGEFEDIEHAKHRMIDLEIEYAQAEGESTTDWTHEC